MFRINSFKAVIDDLEPRVFGVTWSQGGLEEGDGQLAVGGLRADLCGINSSVPVSERKMQGVGVVSGGLGGSLTQREKLSFPICKYAE